MVFVATDLRTDPLSCLSHTCPDGLPGRIELVMTANGRQRTSCVRCNKVVNYCEIQVAEPASEHVSRLLVQLHQKRERAKHPSTIPTDEEEQETDELLKIVLDYHTSELGKARYELLKEKTEDSQPIYYLCQLLNGMIDHEVFLDALTKDQERRRIRRAIKPAKYS